MKKMFLKAAGLIAAAAMCIGIMNVSAVTAQAAVSDYTGKTIAVSGDSISTLYSAIPAGYDFSYPEDVPNPQITQPGQTWWGIVMNNVKGKQGVIAANNNTTVAGNSLEAKSKVGCSMKRSFDIGMKGQPDVIFIYLGVNDLLQDVPLGSYYPGKPCVAEGEVTTFADGYNMMLTKYKTLYPNAQIICMTCPVVTSYTDYETKAGAAIRKNKLGLTILDYNNVIRQVAAGFGCKVIDAYYCGLTPENSALFTKEGIHPNACGMQLIANYVLMSL